jgi:nucleoside-diphosphate-sugar epimerase
LAAGLEEVRGSLEDFESLVAAVKGCQAVINCAAKSGVWGPLAEYIENNTMGPARLLEAARREKVSYFVHTSSPSVIHSGGNLEGVDESVGYSLDVSQPYAYSKMLAERLILGASSGSIKTVALRPHLIWGAEDPHLLPRLAEKAKKGRLYLFSGGPYRVDATYIDNAAEAHLLALEKLSSGVPVSGQAFFIAQDEPMDINDLVNKLLIASRLNPTNRRISKGFGLALAAIIEKSWRLFGLTSEPPITVFAAKQMSTSHWFNLNKAKTLLGYRPLISFERGLEILAAQVAQKGLKSPKY